MMDNEDISWGFLLIVLTLCVVTVALMWWFA